MKVLHIQKVAGVGGSERHLESLLPALVSNDLDVRMCVLAMKDYDRFARRLDDAIPIDIFSAGPDMNPRIVGRLAQLIRTYDPDLVHTHLIHADVHGQLAARLARRPAVSSVHGVHSFYTKVPYKYAARMAARLAVRNIAISNHVRSFLVDTKVARSETIRVIHYGIDARPWRLSAERREAARRTWSLDPDHVAVGMASRLIPYKGHELALTALEAALPRAPAVRLLIAGDGPLRIDLEEMSKTRFPDGVVRFVGHVDDIESFMNACDVLVFPTLSQLGEGFGLAALEAMAAGKPVIATRVASLPEVVVDGDSGILVSPDDPYEMTEALVRLATEDPLRTRLGEGARERASSAFSLERMVDRTIELYREALKR